jgi:hypothetical protein
VTTAGDRRVKPRPQGVRSFEAHCAHPTTTFRQ